jgi:hypothetical protein
MLIAQLNRSDAEKAYISCRSITGATISAGVPVEWDIATVTDGNSVTGCKSGGLASLFVGVTDASMTDSAYGLVQVYGFRTSGYVSRASAGNTPGQWMQATGLYFDAMTMSAATTSGWTYVTLMETIAASAAYSSSAQVYNQNIFIRAL